jgi:hypothetical protein
MVVGASRGSLLGVAAHYHARTLPKRESRECALALAGRDDMTMTALSGLEDIDKLLPSQ